MIVLPVRVNLPNDLQLSLAEFLDKLGAALHTVNKTVSTDTMTAQGACWSQWHHANGDHGIDTDP